MKCVSTSIVCLALATAVVAPLGCVGAADFEPGTSSHESPIRVPPEPFPLSTPYALLVVGGAIGDSQQVDFQNEADFVYDYLRNTVGYTDEDIYYLNVDVGQPNVDALTTVVNIDAAFDTILAQMDFDDQLFVYFVGHGDREWNGGGIENPQLRDGGGEGDGDGGDGGAGDGGGGMYIPPLDIVIPGGGGTQPMGVGYFTFDSNGDGVWEKYYDVRFGDNVRGFEANGFDQLVVVLEFCYSGTFIPPTMLISDCSNPLDDGKYMATACGATECSNGHPWLAYPTFSYYFFNSLKSGSSLEGSFGTAYVQVQAFHPSQHPQQRDCAPKGSHALPTYP